VAADAVEMFSEEVDITNEESYSIAQFLQLYLKESVQVAVASY